MDADDIISATKPAVDVEEDAGNDVEFHEAAIGIEKEPTQRRRSKISGTAMPEMYSDLRKSEEDIVELRIEVLNRKHNIELAQWSSKVETLEEQLKINTQLLNVSIALLQSIGC